jgi:hypothetical protein
MGMRANRRDANEAEIVEFWRRMGCVWIPMKPGQGFDGLLIDRMGLFIVEIKGVGGKLTECEKDLMDKVESLGEEYYIIRDLQDAALLIGLTID